jgi:hypothetical protein
MTSKLAPCPLRLLALEGGIGDRVQLLKSGSTLIHLPKQMDNNTSKEFDVGLRRDRVADG